MKLKMGFALLTPEERKRVSSQGGKAVPGEKRAFSNKDIARRAGKLGGASKHKKHASSSSDPV